MTKSTNQLKKLSCTWKDPKTNDTCSKICYDRGNLLVSIQNNFSYFQVHMRMHTGKKPYVCHICEQRFSTSGNKNDHMRRHAGQKPYACPVPKCEVSYYRKYQLLQHGSSRKHNHISTDEFKVLMSQYIQPNLTVSHGYQKIEEKLDA